MSKPRITIAGYTDVVEPRLAVGLNAQGERVALRLGSGGSMEVTSSGWVSSASQTRPNNTTPYTALDVCGTDAATNMSFAGVGATTGGVVIITSLALRIDVAAIPASMATFRLHLYSSAPTAITDNLAFNLPAADRAKYLGFIETAATPLDLGDTLFARAENINFIAQLNAGSTTLSGILQTVAGYTPTALAAKTVTLRGFSV
jgi:hypothetical protein